MLLIVGAIITSLIIPNFTRQWQDHQKELEVKIALTDEINKATSDINTATALMMNTMLMPSYLVNDG